MMRRSSRRSFLNSSTICIAGATASLARTSRAYAASVPTFDNGRERHDGELTGELGRLIETFNGTVGLYVRHLPTGRCAAFNAEELFPTASMIKAGIMLALFDRIVKGEMTYHQYFEYDGAHDYKGMNDDIVASFRLGAKIRLSKLIMLMITISDNTASKWCQELAGGGTAINTVLAGHGFETLRINSLTPGREDAYGRYGWGQATPRDMCRLIALIRELKAVSPAASEEMYRVLSRVYWNGEALSQIPPWIQTASKSGALNRSRSEVVMVNAPHGDYLFCAVTRDQKDESWGEDNEGFVLMRDISRTLWRYFEPDYRWEPAAMIGDWSR